MSESSIHIKVKKLVGAVWKDHTKYDENYKIITDTLENELRSNSEDILVLTNLGAAYCDLGKHEEAEKLLRKAVALGSKDKNTHFNLGVALINSSSLIEAKKYFQASRQMTESELTYEAYIDFMGL